MPLSLLNVVIKHEHDTLAARQRSRHIARLLGFDSQDQTRIATAVSEIARNAFRYAGGGRVEFAVEGTTSPQLLLIRVSDSGPGIEHLNRILEGRYTSTTGMGMGIMGARRLVDQFEIESAPGRGTTVWLKKVFPRKAPMLTPANLKAFIDNLAQEKPQDFQSELQFQNQELLRALDDLRKRQEELTFLNRELEDTNRGVVALYAELDEKADHLRRADTLKTRFLSNMSHEFRSPLNSILALTGLLIGESDGPLNSEQLQQVKFIRKAADDLYELVNDLLDLAKVEAGKVEVKPVYFEVANLFGALRGMLRPLFLNQSVALVFDECDSLPPIYSDEGKVSQILRNFISNALKFTERGEVRVAAGMIGDRVRFSVADTGIGIGEADQERIFQDFAQVDNPIQRRVKGTGLGLPLSRKLAHLLKGEVSVQSQLGIGSTFSLEIPAQWIVEVPQPEPVLESGDEEGDLVLIVENRADTVLLYSKWLKGTGFRSASVSSIRDAERLIATEKPSAIILDILLNGEDSWNLLASLKDSSETREIPVIVVTTLNDPRKAFHLGADEYLVKPVSREDLLAALRRATAKEQPVCILIVDDTEADRYLLKHCLRGSALTIVEASNGVEGLAKAISERPKAIFLDLVMTGMSGFEVLDALQADPRTESIPVVIQTSKILTGEERSRLSARTVAIFSKNDLQTARLLEVLDTQIGVRGLAFSRPMDR